jgi:tetratricopeptide (TPR) repeat protein
MRLITAAAATLFVALATAIVRAEEPSAATFDAVKAKADELPAGVRIVDGVNCASKAAREFYEDPGYAGSLDCPPDRKSCQSFEGAGGAKGSVLVFEYAGAVPVFITRVLEKSLWGDGGPTTTHPDGYVVQGKLLFVFSFPYGDATGEWAKERLRKKFRVPAQRTRPQFDDLARRMWRAVEKHDEKGGLAAMASPGVDVSDWAMGAYLQGECAADVGEWATAEAAYRRARELSRTLVDPLPANFAWAALDGVGNALLEQKKYADAAKTLTESLAEGRALRLENDDTPHTCYALACALVGLGKWDDALRALTDAVDGNPRWLKLALKTDFLAEARKRKEFRVVLELDPPPPPPAPPPAPPKVPAPPTGTAETATFDALLVKAAELPAGWTLVDGVRCVSTSAAKFFVSPDADKIAGTNLKLTAPPARKACQSIVRPDGTAGSVLLFEYSGAENVDHAARFLGSYCWGEGGSPTTHNPEDIYVSGNRLWVFSFPRGDATGEWAKDRLRRRFRIPVPRTRPEVAPTMKRVYAAYEKHDADAGLRLLDARAARLADLSFAWYLRGEFDNGKQESAGAAAAFRRALELHDAFVDPMDEHIVWASLDGLGGALLGCKKPEDARAALVRAKAFAAEHAMEDTSSCNYNLACALAQLKRFDESLVELKASIAADAQWKSKAKDDSDFAEARKRPDFQELLAK